MFFTANSLAFRFLCCVDPRPVSNVASSAIDSAVSESSRELLPLMISTIKPLSAWDS